MLKNFEEKNEICDNKIVQVGDKYIYWVKEREKIYSVQISFNSSQILPFYHNILLPIYYKIIWKFNNITHRENDAACWVQDLNSNYQEKIFFVNGKFYLSKEKFEIALKKYIVNERLEQNL